jgi:hypothetical protein
VGPGARAFNHDSRRASEHGGHPLIYVDTINCEECSRCCTGASARTGVRRGYGEGMQVRRLYVREWTNRSKRLAFDTAPAWTRVRTAGFAVECLRGREQSVGLSTAGGDGSDINPSPKSSRFQIFQSSRARPRRSHADPPRLVSEFALRGFRYDSKLDLASVHVACADRRHITTLHQTHGYGTSASHARRWLQPRRTLRRGSTAAYVSAGDLRLGLGLWTQRSHGMLQRGSEWRDIEYCLHRCSNRMSKARPGRLDRLADSWVRHPSRQRGSVDGNGGNRALK